MFNFFKSSKETNFSTLQLDLHSHLIPGVDDGAKTIEDSLELIGLLQQLGFRHLVTTPHIMSEFYPNSKATILQGLQQLQQALQQTSYTITVAAAAEYFMDEYFEHLLQQKEELLTLPSKYVLVEMSFLSEPPKLYDYIFQLRTRGYKPILAHPERYLYLEQRDYERLREFGCVFQLNALSVLGHYGSPVKKQAFALLKKGWIEFLGTDMHHIAHAKSLQEAVKKNRSLQKLLHSYPFQNKALVASIA